MAQKKPAPQAARTASTTTSARARRRKNLAASSAVAATLVMGSSFIVAPTAFAAPIDGSGSTVGDVVSETSPSQIIDADAIASGKITNAGQLSSAPGVATDVVSGRAQIVSPISGGHGMYAFDVPQWTDANGKAHHFQSDSNQKYRVFSEPQINPATGNTLRMLRVAGGYTPYAFSSGSGEGLGEFPAGVGTNGNMQRTGVWMYEVPGDYMQAANPVEDSQKPITDNLETQRHTYRGNVWLESGNERQLFDGATATGDAKGEGYTVWASTLTAEGHAANKAIMALAPSERAATKAMLEEHPEYIAATVYDTVDADGDYALHFDDKTFSSDAVYMWLEDPSGSVVPAYSTFTQPVFQSPDFNKQWAPATVPAWGDAYKRWYNVNFAAIRFTPVALDITNYDTSQNPARPGDTANLALTGDLSPLANRIEWRNEAGEVLKSCDIVSTTDLGGCESFTVPSDAADNEIYHAVLITGAQEVAADSFIVQIESVDASSNQPVYDETAAPQGEETTVPAPTNEDGSPLPEAPPSARATTSRTGPPSTRTAPSP